MIRAFPPNTRKLVHSEGDWPGYLTSCASALWKWI